jgi:hypothetical protein
VLLCLTSANASSELAAGVRGGDGSKRVKVTDAFLLNFNYLMISRGLIAVDEKSNRQMRNAAKVKVAVRKSQPNLNSHRCAIN